MTNSRVCWTSIIVIISISLLYLLAPILTPFLAGALLAYLGDPLVNRLMRWHIPRLSSVIIVFVAIFLVLLGLVLLLIPLIEKQIETLSVLIPNTIAWLQLTIVPWLSQHLGVSGNIDVTTVKKTVSENWSKAGNIAGWLLATALHSSMALISFFTSLLLTPVVTFYLLRDWDAVLKGVCNILPQDLIPKVITLARECDTVLGAFFRGQLLVMLALGGIYSIGLMVIGIQIGLLIGILAGLASIVPYLGFIVGIIAASIAAIVQFHSLTMLIYVGIVFVVGNVAESMFLTPTLLGDKIGLHPVAVIFAILAGGSLFGFFGVLLALPAAAVIMVFLRHLHSYYQQSKLITYDYE